MHPCVVPRPGSWPLKSVDGVPYRVAEESDAPVSDDQLDIHRHQLLESIGEVLVEGIELLANIESLYAGANSEFSPFSQLQSRAGVFRVLSNNHKQREL